MPSDSIRRDLGAELGRDLGCFVAGRAAADDRDTCHAAHCRGRPRAALAGADGPAAVVGTLPDRAPLRRLRLQPGPGPDAHPVPALAVRRHRLAAGLAADLRRRGSGLGRRAGHPGRGARQRRVRRPVRHHRPRDRIALDKWESADTGLYRTIRLRVSTLEGDVLAWTYVLNGYEGGLPSARYLGLIAEGAEAAGAPADYVAELRNRPCRSIG